MNRGTLSLLAQPIELYYGGDSRRRDEEKRMDQNGQSGVQAET